MTSEIRSIRFSRWSMRGMPWRRIAHAVWSDENLPDGIGLLIMKGEHRLNGTTDSGTSASVEIPSIEAQTTVDAVLCDSAEHAAALRLVLGEVV